MAVAVWLGPARRSEGWIGEMRRSVRFTVALVRTVVALIAPGELRQKLAHAGAQAVGRLWGGAVGARAGKSVVHRVSWAGLFFLSAAQGLIA